MSVNINSYRAQRDKHLSDVSIILATHRGTATGTALRNAISMVGPSLKIYPYFNYDIYSEVPWQPKGLNATTGHVPKKGTRGLSIIMFNPFMWNQKTKRGTAGRDGPGSDADEVLFHELVHGLRYLVGVNATHNLLNNDYRDEEEFIAVVVSNIYLAERIRRRCAPTTTGSSQCSSRTIF